MTVPSKDYSYCKIFVKADGIDSLKTVIATLFGGQFQRNSLLVGNLVVDVRSNSDAIGSADLGDDFVRWPILVELDEEDRSGRREIVAAVDRILQALWHADHPAVAACDFEDELPWGGGIRRLGA